jgi:hypothetical protein
VPGGRPRKRKLPCASVTWTRGAPAPSSVTVTPGSAAPCSSDDGAVEIAGLELGEGSARRRQQGDDQRESAPDPSTAFHHVGFSSRRPAPKCATVAARVEQRHCHGHRRDALSGPAAKAVGRVGPRNDPTRLAPLICIARSAPRIRGRDPDRWIDFENPNVACDACCFHRDVVRVTAVLFRPRCGNSAARRTYHSVEEPTLSELIGSSTLGRAAARPLAFFPKLLRRPGAQPETRCLVTLSSTCVNCSRNPRERVRRVSSRRTTA